MIKNKNIPHSFPQQPQKRNKNGSSLTATYLAQLDREFQEIKKEILGLTPTEAKPIQIRVKAWIDKFQSIVEVELWRKNRNLYSKVLMIMLKKKALSHPFNKLPPSSSLPMLSLYEIAYDVRQELERLYPNSHIVSKYENESEKQNISQLSNKNSVESSLTHQRSKQRYSVLSKALHKQSQEITGFEKQGLQKEISQTVRSSYDFILKNMDQFTNKEEVKDLLEELWNFSTLR